MSLMHTIEEMQTLLVRLRAEASFDASRTAFRAGADHFSDQVELIIARRLELLDNWTPQLAGATRKHELHHIREAIRRIAQPDNQ